MERLQHFHITGLFTHFTFKDREYDRYDANVAQLCFTIIFKKGERLRLT